MSISMKHVWQLGIAIVVLGLLGLLALSIPHMLTHTTHVASPTFIYPPTNSKMVTDNSIGLLHGDPKGAQVVQTPPTIDFGLVDINPQRYGTEYGAWGNVVRGPDGKYYFGFGNHSSSQGGQDGSLLVSYDPATKKHEILLFSKDLFGPSGEGKWHGRPEINPRNGDMYLIGFYHGHVVYYNIYTKQAKDLGAPVPGSGWPEFSWDWRRERLYGVGDGTGSILVYDTKNKTVIHQGRPVDSVTGQAFRWDDRARLIDQTTGNVYGSDQNNHITKYDPTTNTFTIMKSTLPSTLRAWTNEKDADGSFWIFDRTGNVFKFYPEQDRLQPEGKNWANGVYTASIERSPDGHFLYYSVADNGPATATGLPIIQYNTQTNQKKAIAFLIPFYARTHNYQTTKIYGEALSADGSSLFVISNGNIVNGPRIPSMLDIHIPASER